MAENKLKLTKEQFWEWLNKEFYPRFPAVMAWHNQLENKAAVLKQWWIELKEWTEQELTEVAQEYAAGLKKPPEAYEREYWPAFLQVELKRIQASRQLSEQPFSYRITKEQCPDCHDTGICVDTDYLGQPMGYACHCSRGNKYAEANRPLKRKLQLVNFSPGGNENDGKGNAVLEAEAGRQVLAQMDRKENENG